MKFKATGSAVDRFGVASVAIVGWLNAVVIGASARFLGDRAPGTDLFIHEEHTVT
jgi:hypothetical protein